MEREWEIYERKGLHKARNSNGTITKAGPNITGRFKCIYCGCELYVTHRDSNYYFACVPGGQHDKYKPCYAMVEHGHGYSDPNKSPSELIQALLLPAAPSRGGNVTPGISRGPGVAITPDEDGPNDSPIKTLKDLIKNGTQYYNPNDPFGDSYKVSDFLITHKTVISFQKFKKLLRPYNNEFLEILGQIWVKNQKNPWEALIYRHPRDVGIIRTLS